MTLDKVLAVFQLHWILLLLMEIVMMVIQPQIRPWWYPLKTIQTALRQMHPQMLLPQLLLYHNLVSQSLQLLQWLSTTIVIQFQFQMAPKPALEAVFLTIQCLWSNNLDKIKFKTIQHLLSRIILFHQLILLSHVTILL